VKKGVDSASPITQRGRARRNSENWGLKEHRNKKTAEREKPYLGSLKKMTGALCSLWRRKIERSAVLKHFY